MCRSHVFVNISLWFMVELKYKVRSHKNKSRAQVATDCTQVDVLTYTPPVGLKDLVPLRATWRLTEG